MGQQLRLEAPHGGSSHSDLVRQRSRGFVLIVGALVVAVGIFAYFLFADRGGRSDVNIKVDVPKVEVPAEVPKQP